jgi:thiamine-phosphate pyrophosphorylase
MSERGVSTQLLLALAAEAGRGDDLVRITAAALKVGPIATVVIELDADAPLATPDLAACVAGIQNLGVATLIAGDAALARIVKADGVHLPASKAAPAAYSDARENLGGRFIVGVDVGRTRHDAMQLGEAGADYIAFGIPAFVEDRATAANRRLDLVEWWAEIFEIPCVAFDVETPEEARALTNAGADFVAVRLPAAISPDEIATMLTPFVQALAMTAPAT